jgi:two-component system, cell cycle sensor histidine kinase and response regulator CckA
MIGPSITDSKLSEEISILKQRIKELEQSKTDHKRVEDELRTSEAKFKEIFETIEDLYYETDSEGIVKNISPSIYRLSGWNQEDIIGKSTTMFYADSNDREQLLLKLLEKGYLHDYEVLLRIKDGQVRQGSLSARLILDDNGRPVGLRGLLRDITERKLIERELRESEARWQFALEGAGDGVWDWDVITGSVFFSTRWKAMLGYAEDEIGSTLDEWDRRVHPDDKACAYADLERHFRQETEYYQNEHRMLCKDGSCKWILDRGKVIKWTEDGKPRRVIGTHTDITKHKLAEAALQKSEKRLRQIIDLVPQFIFAKNREGRFILVNKAVADAYGTTVEELTGKTDGDFNPNKDEINRFLRDDLLVMDSGKPKEIDEEHITDSKGNTRILQTVKIPFTLSLKGDDAILGVSTDITEQKQSEEEKTRLESQLRQAQKMEAMGTLVGGIAHDFNNILTAINGFGTLLQMTMEESSPQRRYVNQIILSSQKAANLTRSLLTFSREQPVILTPTSINTCIKGTEKLLKRLLTEDIELSTSFAPEDIITMADATQIDQILFNLATNSRDAMKNGGKLNIETKLFHMDNRFKDLHGFGYPGKFALMTVSDNGGGMDESTKERIFDPFFTTKELGKGTGLGLSTVYGIVKQHNGYIDVSSRPGLGTTFSIYLPAVEITAGEETSFLPVIIKGGNENILIAEDDTDVRLFMKESLIGHGYNIFEATDGQDVIDKFKEHKNIDLIILDSVMPRKNGREAYDEIRIIKPFTKTLFMSGYTKDIILNKGIEEGEVNFITKPFSRDELIKKVRDVLDK